MLARVLEINLGISMSNVNAMDLVEDRVYYLREHMMQISKRVFLKKILRNVYCSQPLLH